MIRRFKGDIRTSPSDLGSEISDREDLDSQGEGSSQPDTISLASRTSQNTLDSDKVIHTRILKMSDPSISLTSDDFFSLVSSLVAVR